jgi:two-component system, LytTR family, response regulator
MRSPRGNTILSYNLCQIMYIESSGNYSIIYLYDLSKHMVTKTLKQCGLMLDPCKFIRCHDKYLVNIEHLKSKNIYKSNELTLITEVRIPISRRKRALVNKILKGIRIMY